MLFFGHVGITLGVAKTCDYLLSKPVAVTGAGSTPTFGLRRKIKERIGNVDYRLVIIGSLLPDIIDKPIFMLFGGAHLSGRDYAHSLLFNVLLFTGGLLLTRKKKSWLIVLSLSSLAHLLFDQIWIDPVTLWWPLLGPLLPGNRSSFVTDVLHNMLTPEIFIPEIIGLAILIYFKIHLIKAGGIRSFLKSGFLA